MQNPLNASAQLIRLLETLPVILAKGILSINDLTVAVDKAAASLLALAEHLTEADRS